MKYLVFVAVLLLSASCAQAGRLTNTFTAPSFEASVSGDTCAAGTIAQVGNLTVRRRWSGTAAGQDSLVNVAPGTPVTLFAGVANGTYVVTVDVRDAAGNLSCPATITQIVKGKPARVSNLGWSPDTMRRYWASVMLESSRSWIYL